LATRIRLKRTGGKHDPHFRIVVADARTQRDGKTIEELGHYDPCADPPEIKVDAERALHWLHVGAQPSDTVRSLLKKTGVMGKFHGIDEAAQAGATEAASDEPEAVSEQAEEPEDRGDSEQPDEEATPQ
jgi:small subunit ribosomal protein S16